MDTKVKKLSSYPNLPRIIYKSRQKRVFFKVTNADILYYLEIVASSSVK